MIDHLHSLTSRIAATVKSYLFGPETRTDDLQPTNSPAPVSIDDDLTDPCHPDNYAAYEAQCRDEIEYGPDPEDIAYEYELEMAEEEGIARYERRYALEQKKLQQQQ